MLITLREVVDGAVLVEYPDASESDANRAAVDLSHALSARLPGGLLDAIPAARTLLLLFDARVMSFDRLADEVLASKSEKRVMTRAPERRSLRIPVCYGGRGGPDLPDLAARLGLSEVEIGRRHSSAKYAVAFIGFSPGFPYLTGLPALLHAPRLATPRTRVPSGSVAIGGPYTGIYPEQTPGGWRLIGRTPVRLFDPEATPPALLRPGDEVSFEAIGEEELLRSEASGRPAGRTPVGRAVFRVTSPGLWSSVQGAPRFGLGSSGVPPGGAMDLVSLSSGNERLGNPSAASAIEITMVGPELECLASYRVVLCGAQTAAERNGMPLAAGQVHTMREGDRLRFGKTEGGSRSYLCVEGGLEMHPPSLPSRRLEKSDLVHAGRAVNSHGARGPDWPASTGTGALRVVLGPQIERFAPEAVDQLTNRPWRVSPVSDRRGVRLEGEPLGPGLDADIPPEGTALGAIQVPPDGLPIVLGPDRPVTGGYAKIATIVPEDWPRAAQALPGTELRFEVTRSGRTRSATVERRGEG